MNKKVSISYGLGAVGKDMVYMLSAGYVLYYYQDVLGVSSIFMGTLLLIARVFDAMNDPIMGILVAKTRSKFGKFRPWLFSGTILNAMVLFALFAAPTSFTGVTLKVYAAIVYILWGVTYTMMDIPYWSMIPALADTSSAREKLSTLARSCAGVGSALITIFTIMIVDFLGSGAKADYAAGTDAKILENAVDRQGFMWFALIIAIFFIIAEVITCLNVKEKPTKDMETTTVKKMFSALFKNDQALTVVIAIVCINTALYITSNLVIYFFKYDIGGVNWKGNYTLFNSFGGGIQILSMMLFYPLLRKILSTLQVFRVSIAMAAGYVILLALSCFNMTSLILLCIPAFLVFSANGMLCVLTTLFLSNSVDYGELKNNRRDESVIFSMQTFVYKLSSGVAVWLASVCIAVFHISNDTTDTEAAVTLSFASSMGLRLTMTILPMFILLIAVVFFMKKFKLTDNEVERISKELQKRKGDTQ